MLILAFLVLAAALAVTSLHHLFDLLGGILERVETEDPGELYVGEPQPIHQRATRPGARSLEGTLAAVSSCATPPHPAPR